MVVVERDRKRRKRNKNFRNEKVRQNKKGGGMSTPKNSLKK